MTEETDLGHPRVLKRHYIEIDGTKWEVSTVRLVGGDDPEDLIDVFLQLSDMIDGIGERYETMIFKIVDDARLTSTSSGASSFGHYRSNDSQDVVKAHDQIVSLIAEGKLIPIGDESGSTVSKHILKAMMREEVKPTDENQVAL